MHKSARNIAPIAFLLSLIGTAVSVHWHDWGLASLHAFLVLFWMAIVVKDS
jgi:hypothetical protein